MPVLLRCRAAPVRAGADTWSQRRDRSLWSRVCAYAGFPGRVWGACSVRPVSSGLCRPLVSVQGGIHSSPSTRDVLGRPSVWYLMCTVYRSLGLARSPLARLRNAGVATEVSLQSPVSRSLGHSPLCLHVTLCYLLRLLGSPPPPRGVWGRRAAHRLFAWRRETVEVRFTVPSPPLVLTRVAESYGSDIRGSAGAPGPASLCDAC